MPYEIGVATLPWNVEQLLALGREALIDIFRSLPAPSPESMDGEFESALPNESNDAWRSAMARLGKPFWLGKSYTPEPLDGHRGHGLNRYRQGDESILRMSRFVWDIGASVVDGRPSLVMRYAPFDNWGGSHDLIDEIRVAGPGVHLGIYHTAQPVPGFTPRAAGHRSGLELFTLTGPTSGFVQADLD